MNAIDDQFAADLLRGLTFDPHDADGGPGDEWDDDNPRFLPTPQEIAEACAEIQKTWSVREEKRRRGVVFVRDSEYLPPRSHAGEPS